MWVTARTAAAQASLPHTVYVFVCAEVFPCQLQMPLAQRQPVRRTSSKSCLVGLVFGPAQSSEWGEVEGAAPWHAPFKAFAYGRNSFAFPSMCVAKLYAFSSTRLLG